MLDKKALRKFIDGNPAPAIPPGHGLLHAKQVDYVIRTDTRTIGRRRTLVLHIYDRKRTAAGDPAPVWTMFQAGADYVTLARRDDGSVKWRESSFERLGGDYRFTGKCAFYSARDERRVCDFLRDHDGDGITALVRAQRNILDGRCRERRRRREKRTVERMRPIRALPRGLEGWIRRSVMPAYFRCEHTSAREPVTGICTSCGKKAVLPRAAHNDKIICPHCKRELTVKSAGKMGRHYDRDTVQVVERTGDNEIVARIVKVYYHYGRDGLMPVESIRENARVFVRRGPDGKAIAEPYYCSYDDGKWKRGTRPVFSHYQYNFEADTCGHVYCGNLPGALAGTPWEYCPVKPFYGHFREPMQLAPFLAAHLEHPKLEHLVKVGFFSLASDLAYGRLMDGELDESRDRTHRLLRVDAGDVAFLRELDADAQALKLFRGYAGLKDRRRLLRWQLEYGVTYDVDRVLERMTAHKLMGYLDGQYAAPGPDGGRRYAGMQRAVSEYRDYLDMCAKLGYDLDNSFVLWPRELDTAHDKARKHLKAKADAKMRRDFDAAMRSISDHLDFEADGLKIVLPGSPDDVIAEGQALHHCVGGYVDRVARHECVILFVRQCGDESKPYYTVEIRDRKVVQLRGMRNCDPTPKVRKFVDRFEQRVLRAA